MRTEQKKGLAAILAVVAVVASFLMTFTGSPVVGLILALVALPLGGVGMVAATSSTVSGGLMSLGSLVAAFLAMIFAVLGIAGVLLF